jgi:hypothetical protein
LIILRLCEIFRQFLAERDMIDEAVRKIQLENEVATLQERAYTPNTGTFLN